METTMARDWSIWGSSAEGEAQGSVPQLAIVVMKMGDAWRLEHRVVRRGDFGAAAFLGVEKQDRDLGHDADLGGFEAIPTSRLDPLGAGFSPTSGD